MALELEQQETFIIEGPQLEPLGQVESKLPAPARKRPVAAAALAVVAFVSVGGIGGFKLRGARAAAAAVYTQADEYGNSIGSDLAAGADAAASLIRLGGRILGEDAAEVTYAAEQLAIWNATPAEPDEQYDQFAALSRAVEDLYLAAGRKADDDQAAQLDALYAELTSRRDIVAHTATDTYNPAATRYNETAARFPANLIGTLWGLEPVPLYGPSETGRDAAGNASAMVSWPNGS